MHLTILWVVALSRPVEICQEGHWHQHMYRRTFLLPKQHRSKEELDNLCWMQWHIP